MKFVFLLLLWPLGALAAEHDHAAMEPEVITTAAQDHAAMSHSVDEATANAMNTTMIEHGGMFDYLLMADRFERHYQRGDDSWLWDAHAWIGGDYDKLWLKTEGEWSDRLHEVEHGELQLLYSHAIAPFWDLQTGVRHDDGTAAARSYAVLGFKGLAPYWFEIEGAAFVSERGDVQVHVAASYELRLTQKLLLQPRLQLNHSFASDKAANMEKGSFDSNLALRLRYEFAREFAPYIGVEHDIGGNRKPDDHRIVVGIRFWY